MTPTIETERLTLYPYRWATQEHVDWLNDPEVVKFSEQRHRTHSIKTQTEYMAVIPDGSYIWLIRPRGGEDIGTITAYVDEPNKLANMGILIGNKAAWGHGYGSEAWGDVMSWLFHCGIRKVEAGCMRSNIGMAKLAIRCGMDLEGARVAHFLVGEQHDDMLMWARFR